LDLASWYIINLVKINIFVTKKIKELLVMCIGEIQALLAASCIQADQFFVAADCCALALAAGFRPNFQSGQR
jgi:hypothetical protein